jgi:GNAT superfamily N-acetyltransferase
MPHDSKVKQAVRVYRESGLAGLSRALLGRVYERTDFVGAQRDLHSTPPDIRCTVEFELRRIEDSLLTRFRDMGYPFSRHHEYRFEFGMRRCYGAFVGERIAALMWPLFQADNRLTVTRWRYLWPDEARISNAWADPAFRGTGLIDAAFERMTAAITAAGFRYMYGYTWIENHSSRKFQARLGYKEVTRVVRYSFGWQREGRGIYLRQKVPRDLLPATHPRGDMELPEVIA